MSSRRKSNRPRNCAGCNVNSTDHTFGTMSKFCTGPPPQDSTDDEEPVHYTEGSKRGHKTTEETSGPILLALQSLAGQIETLQLDQKHLREKVESYSVGGGSATTPATPGNNLYLLPYVDLLTLLNSPQSPDDSSSSTKETKRKPTIESFDQWLEAWTVYEKNEIIDKPARYHDMASYRLIIQKANRKFSWTAVYEFDVQFRRGLSTIQGRLDMIDTTLYATILDSSAVRKESSSCARCKSLYHLVRDCPFRARTAVEENKKEKTNEQWKYDRWTHNGTEGCNLYQRRACQQGKDCKRAHVCKSCRGNHANADCNVHSTKA